MYESRSCLLAIPVPSTPGISWHLLSAQASCLQIRILESFFWESHEHHTLVGGRPVFLSFPRQTIYVIFNAVLNILKHCKPL